MRASRWSASTTSESIDASRAAALPGVKAVVTAKDFPEQANLIVPTGEMQVNLKDITRNIMAREKALSALGMTKGARLMLSTPPAIIRPASPALMARAAAWLKRASARTREGMRGGRAGGAGNAAPPLRPRIT